MIVDFDFFVLGGQFFWKIKFFEDMIFEEWEFLCDGCVCCCFNKLEDWDIGEIVWINVVCIFLDGVSCWCKDYGNWVVMVFDCI